MKTATKKVGHQMWHTTQKKVFCENKIADLILLYLDKKASKKDVHKIKLALTKYLEESVEDKEGSFNEDFVLDFTEALFSTSPKKSLQEVFREFCREEVLINKKLHVIFCTDLDSFVGYCYDWKLSFYKTITDAVKSTGINPKTFAKQNKISFKKIWDSYTCWYMGSGQCNKDVYQQQISGSVDFIKLCDFFGIKVEKVKDPYDWWVNRNAEPGFEYDMKEAILESSKEECRYFARWFSKKPTDWFYREEEDWESQFD